MSKKPPVPTKLRDFEFRLFQRLKKLGISKKSVLVACSGGLDSVVLVTSLQAVAAKLGLTIKIVHVHHGKSSKNAQRRFRDDAADLVRKLARNFELEFNRVDYEGEKPLASEEQFRDFRLEQIARVAGNSDFVAFAHHADDLLETRLIRLVRGTGPLGLTAMQELAKTDAYETLRPLLTERRAEIEDYAKLIGLEWCEDPSNRENEALRNWMRNIWLPALDAKRPGSTTALMRSLAAVGEACAVPAPSGKPEFVRLEYSHLELDEQRVVVHGAFTSVGSRGFTARQVAEVVKRLMSPRKLYHFDVGDVRWSVRDGKVLASLRQNTTNAESESVRAT